MGSKIRAYTDRILMDLARGAGFFLIAGEILATGDLPLSPGDCSDF